MTASRAFRPPIALALLLFTASAAPCLAAPNAVPGEVIVKYRAGLAAAGRARALAALPAAQAVQTFDFIGAERLRFDGLTTDEAIARLESDPGVAYAEPNYVVTADVIPNDPSFTQLWNLHNTGQGGAYAGDDIHATQAWDLFTGDPNLKVGVIDTGIDYTHPDLAANVWTNPGEIPGNGIDDDGNGYVDDVHGYDVLNHDGDPMDDGTHGTHVAGTIAAVGNNGVGIVGVNWQCKMVAIKFMNSQGVGSEADAIAAIQYAIAVGVKVTNNSWGNMPGGQALLDAINAAGVAGQLFVCAAGNNGWNIDAVPVYPPSFVTPYMITVAATDGRDQRPTWSNYGATTVHLGAPGLNVYSCKPGNAYQALSGTSMSAPHVTGVAALAFGYFPQATNLAIRDLILRSTDPIASMAGITVTGGRLDAYKVLTGDPIPPARITDLGGADVGSTAMALAWTAPGDDGMAGTATRYDLRMSTTPIDSSNFAGTTAITVTAPHAAGSHESAALTSLPCITTLYFAIVAIDEAGNAGAISNLASATTLGIPQISLAPAALELTLAPGQMADSSVVVGNAGAGRLDFTVPLASPAPWLNVTTTTGRVAAGTALPVAVHLDATGLLAGDHTTTITIASNDPATPAAGVPVTLHVRDLTAVPGAPTATLALRMASANPVRGEAVLELSLPTAGLVDVAVFDVRGARVTTLAAGVMPAGSRRLRWNALDPGARSLPGVYFVEARTPTASIGRRVVLLE